MFGEPFTRKKYRLYKFQCAPNTSLTATWREGEHKFARGIPAEVSGDRGLILITRSLFSILLLIRWRVSRRSQRSTTIHVLVCRSLGSRNAHFAEERESLFRRWYHYPVKVPPVIRTPPRFCRGFFLFFFLSFDRRLSYFHLATLRVVIAFVSVRLTFF